MPQKDIAEALAGSMREDGCELDCTDRLIIRQTLYRALTAQRRRADRERSATKNYIWRKPSPRRNAVAVAASEAGARWHRTLQRNPGCARVMLPSLVSNWLPPHEAE